MKKYLIVHLCTFLCLYSVIFSYSSVDMREVKEVRVGKCFKDFDRWPEESGRVDAARCFIVLYGSEFKLKTLSIAGKKKVLLIYLPIIKTEFQ
jgi:hypothetical protein